MGDPRPRPQVDTLRDAIRLHPLARRLPLTFSAVDMASEVAALPADWWRRHLGPYHDGGWESISLWAPGGNLHQQRSQGGPFAATPALKSCPYLGEVLMAFSGARHRIRLMRLRTGGRILRHSDPAHTISRDLTRIHVPITTSPEVSFIVNGRRIPFQPGEAWHIEVRFPHEVTNASPDDRVHMVIDLIADAGLRQLLDNSTVHGRGLLTGYFAKHSLPQPVRQWLNIGN